jgi:hypothetical protein
MLQMHNLPKQYPQCHTVLAGSQMHTISGKDTMAWDGNRLIAVF